MAKSAKKATPPEVVSNRCSKIEVKTRQPTWAHPGGAVGLAGAARLAETGSSACAAYGSMAPNSASRPYAERSSSSVMVGPKCRQLGNHRLGHQPPGGNTPNRHTRSSAASGPTSKMPPFDHLLSVIPALQAHGALRSKPKPVYHRER